MGHEKGRRRWAGAKVAFATAVAGTLATALLAADARRTRRSFAGEFVSVVVLRARRNRAEWSTFERRARLIAENQKTGPALPPARLRARYDVSDVETGGMRTFIVRPRSGATQRRILYVHGGAYVFDLSPEHWAVIEGLASRTGATMTVPIYPLAPEHDWQPAFASISEAYESLVAEAGAENVVVAGDSAGGGIVLALAQTWRDAGVRLPAALLLFSPWADATTSDPAQTELAKRDLLLTIDGLREYAFGWAGARETNDPVVSPLFGSLVGLPPMLVFTGTDDILNSDAHRLATSARADNARLDLSEYKGMFHGWVAAPIPEARRALDEAGRFVVAHTVTSRSSVHIATPRPARADVRRRVIEGAFVAFTERGFMGASIDFICSRAKLSRGAFYSNFADKDELFFALYERQAGYIIDRMRRGIERIRTSGEPLESFKEMVRAPDPAEMAWDIINKEFVIHALRNESARTKLIEHRAHLRREIVVGLEAVFAILGRSQPLDLDELARFIVALHEGELTQRGLEPQLRDGESLEARFIPVLLASL